MRVLMVGLLAAVGAWGQAYNHVVGVVFDGGGNPGELRAYEDWGGGGDYLGWRAPASLAGTVVWTWPAADGSSGQALVTNGSGVLSWGGGGGGLPVVDTTAIVHGSGDATKLLRFEVDGFTTGTTRVLTPQDASYTVAGTDISNLFSADQGFTNDRVVSWRDTAATSIGVLKLGSANHVEIGHLNNATGDPDVIFFKDGTAVAKLNLANDATSGSSTALSWTPNLDRNYQIGGSTAMWRRGWFESMHLGRNNSSNQVAGDLNIYNLSFGAPPFRMVGGADVSIGSAPMAVVTGTLNVSSSGTYNLGGNPATGSGYGRWNTLWVNTVNAASASTFGSAVTFNGGITIPSGTNSTIRAGSGGAMYITPRGIASGSVGCGGVADGWIEITTDDYIVMCRGGTRMRTVLTPY